MKLDIVGIGILGHFWPDDLHIQTWPIFPGDRLNVWKWAPYVKAFDSYHHRHQQAWARGGKLTLKILLNVLCISSYSKTLSRPIIYPLFSQFFVGLAPDPKPPDCHRGSTPRLCWGTFVSKPPNLPSPGNNPAGVHGYHLTNTRCWNYIPCCFAGGQ